MKRQNNVVALVHKETEGERPLRESVPSGVTFHQLAWQLGDKASGLHWWCSSISWALASRRAAPQKQSFSGLKRYESFAKGLKRDFVLRSRLSWTCLDCPPSSCQQLDEDIAKQVKSLQQAVTRVRARCML